MLQFGHRFSPRGTQCKWLAFLGLSREQEGGQLARGCSKRTNDSLSRQGACAPLRR